MAARLPRPGPACSPCLPGRRHRPGTSTGVLPLTFDSPRATLETLSRKASLRYSPHDLRADMGSACAAMDALELVPVVLARLVHRGVVEFGGRQFVKVEEAIARRPQRGSLISLCKQHNPGGWCFPTRSGQVHARYQQSAIDSR